jgi:hypothetical protein
VVELVLVEVVLQRQEQIHLAIILTLPVLVVPAEQHQ